MNTVLLVILIITFVVNLLLVYKLNDRLEAIEDTLVDCRIIYNKTQQVFREMKDYFYTENIDK